MTEREIFEAALEISEAKPRAAFVASACGQDPQRIARIESLLASHAADTGFLQMPVLDQGIRQLKHTDGGATKADDDRHAHANEPDLSFLEPSSQPDSIGSLGHYRILDVLGQGYFGIVFKAFDETLHRAVAVKVLKPELATTSPPRKRFLREARSAALIQDENVIRVHSVAEHPLPHLVMEYSQGQTLQTRLDATGPLDLLEIVELGRQIASGLAAAHEHGLIHRDIKPANILLECRDGTGLKTREPTVTAALPPSTLPAQWRVKITDFGLARATDDASLTHSGLIVGTPLFMSPEQARGDALDHRSDLFSLGSVLYTMATGRPPFRAENTLAVLKRVTECRPRPIAEIIPETPDWLIAIIGRLHAEQPADRFASARELAELFNECLAQMRRDGRVQLPTNLFPAQGRSAADCQPAVLPGSSASFGEPASAQQTSPRRRTLLIPGLAGIIAILGIAEATGITSVLTKVTDRVAALPQRQAINHSLNARTISNAASVSAADNSSRSDASVSPPSALEFDGVTAWVALPVEDDRLAPFTVEAWMKPNNPGRLATIIAAFRAPRGIGMSIFEDQLEAAVSYLDAPVWSTAKSRRSPDPLRWQHVAAVVTETRIELYLDGHRVALCEIHGEHLPSGSFFNVGGFEGRDLFSGLIDEIRISRAARYTDDFQPQRRFEPDDDTLGLYHCDESSEDELLDSSGHARHGRIHQAKRVRIPDQDTPLKRPGAATQSAAGVPIPN